MTLLRQLGVVLRMPRPSIQLAIAALLLLGGSSTAFARQVQQQFQPNDSANAATQSTKLPANAALVPFFVGEKLNYDVKFSFVKAGTGSMEVKEIVDVRGSLTWHTVFRFSGGIPLFRVDDQYESWFDVVSLSSRRYHQIINEGNYKPRRHYEFYPERGVYQEGDKPEQVTVENPLDDGSFLYFVRTIPLEVGKEYTFSRYFNPQSNPVTIKVLRRDTVKVPAGTFSTVVLQPTFKTKSAVFGESSKAEVWITDDSRRMMVQMKSQLSIGSINLYLKSHNAKPPAPK